MPERVVLFVDWQNVFNGARALFHHGQQSQSTNGQIDPVKLGELICRRSPAGTERVLQDVRVYCGIAERRQDPVMFASRSNQLPILGADRRKCVHPPAAVLAGPFR